VQDGIQIALETTLLGDKTKEVIRDAITSLGEDAGNPLENPYCIQWQYRKNAAKFDEKYHALRIERVKPSPAIEKLIIDTEPPGVTHIIERGNPTTLRANLQAAYCGPKDLIDWGACFDAAEAEYVQTHARAQVGPTHPQRSAARPASNGAANGQQAKARMPEVNQPEPEPEAEEQENVEEQEPAQAAPKQAPAKAAKAKPAQKPAAQPAPAPVADDEDVECDECADLMKATDTVCPTCGFDYSPAQAEPSPEPEPEKPAAPPPRKKRGAAAAPAAEAPAKAKASKAKPAQEPEPEQDDGGWGLNGDGSDDDSPIPF
jgi:hypothetical protein